MPYRKSQNGSFIFDVVFEGVRHRKMVQCSAASHVDVLYRRWERNILDGLSGKHKLFDKIDEYLKWSRSNKSETRAKEEGTYLSFAKEFFKNIDLGTIRKYHIVEFASWRRTRTVRKSDGTVGNYTVNHTVKTFCYFLGWCQDRDYIRFNPGVRLRLKPGLDRIRSMSPEQIRAILKESRDYERTFLMVLFCAGMRHKSEILNLRWRDVHFDKGLILLSGKFTKNDRNSQKAIPNVLIEYLKNVPRTSDEWVVSRSGERMKSFRYSWKRLRGVFPWLKEYTIHDLRHVYATTLLNSGTPLIEIQALLDHKQISTTMKYAHFDTSRRPNVTVLDKIIGDARIERSVSTAV